MVNPLFFCLTANIGQGQNGLGYNHPMSRTAASTGHQLTDALRALNINFILGGNSQDAFLHKSPTRLIAALAESEEARLRLSLIPLFLEHPEFAAYVKTAAKKLPISARLTLQCYYSAAVWFALMYQPQHPLPDHFSKELGLAPSSNPEANLSELAKRHKEISGRRINWLGTYQHAIQVWQRGREFKAAR